MYLLDANTLIHANATYYPISRIPYFWDWLIEQGRAGVCKLPNEIADEITVGHGSLSDWLKEADAKAALRLDEAVDVALLRQVVGQGYAPNLNDVETTKIGRDWSAP